MPDSGQRDWHAMVRGVRQRAGVRPRQPQELLDGRGRDTHSVRVRADGHMRGRPRERQDAAGDAQAPAAGRRVWRRRPARRTRRRGQSWRRRRRLLRRVRGGGRVAA